MPLPLEFHHIGRPASVNGTSQEKQDWRRDIAAATDAKLTQKFAGQPVPKPYLTSKGVPKAVGGKATVKVFFFPHNQQYIDIDNGLKYTIDGIAEALLTNDKLVSRIVSERFLPGPGISIIAPASRYSTLAAALAISSPSAASAMLGRDVVAIKIEDYQSNRGKYW